jgi:hypothetical protein
MPPPLPVSHARALLSAAATRAFSSSSASSASGCASGGASGGGVGDGARSLYRAALRAIRALPDQGARDYYKAYARQNVNEFREERDPERVSQLLQHGQASLKFLAQKHGAGGGGEGSGGKGGGGGGGGSSRR